MKLPYEGKIYISSPYGSRILNGQPDWHPGLDLVGQTEKIVRAPCDGKIVSSIMVPNYHNGDRTWEWGNYIRLDGEGYSIFMCHLNQRMVSAGDIVKAGQPIGIEGNTGYSFGQHCHFEIRKDGCAVNPYPILGIPTGAGYYYTNTFNEVEQNGNDTNIPAKEEDDDMITQEQFNLMFHQALLDLAKEPASKGWGEEAMIWAEKEGLIKGDENGNTMPRKPITREEFATVLKRYDEKR